MSAVANPPRATLLHVLAERLASDPERELYTFLDEGGRESDRLDYRGLIQRAAAVAELLRREGCEPGERVLLVFPPDGLEFVASLFGCMIAGVIAVPVSSPDPRNLDRDLPTLRHIAANCEASFALTHTRYRRLSRLFAARDTVRSLVSERRLELADWPDLTWLDANKLRPARVDEARALLDRAVAQTGPEAIAFLQYTSGSTSSPRGVVIGHRNVLHNLELIASNTHVDEHSVLVGWVPLYHDMGLTGGILNAAYTGSRCVFFSPLTFLKRPGLWLEALTRYRGTHAAGPNFGYEYVLRAVDEGSRYDLSRWKVALQGGEPMRARTVARVGEKLSRFKFEASAFCNIYGMAETVLFVCGRVEGAPTTLRVDARALEIDRRIELVTAGGVERALTLIGCGAPDRELGVDVRVVDPDARVELGAGAVGELWLSSPSNARGYWGWSEAQNAERFRARIEGDAGGREYLRTGDLGFVHEGEVFICGRRKDLLIIAGRNIYPHDIEQTIERADAMVRPGNVACFGAEVDGGERLVAVLEVKANTHDSLEEVAEAVRALVARTHQLPCHEVVLIEPRTLPKTTSGKVQRSRCRQLWSAGELRVVHRVRGAHVVTLDTDEPEHSHACEDEGLAPFVDILAEVLGTREALGPEARVSSLGLDSVQAIEVCDLVHTRLGRDLDATLLLGEISVREVWAAVRHRPARERGSKQLRDLGELRIANAPRAVPRSGAPLVGVELSLMFFASRDAPALEGIYATFLEAVERADRGRLHAVWIPERHFHPFGGLFPNPSVLASAVAMKTEHVRIRAGSVVLPLHDPIRVAEEWAVVDNLSGGRVDLAFASGWHQNDFVLAPQRYDDHVESLPRAIEVVERLWRGEAIERENGRGEPVEISIHPRPLQPELEVWHTAARNPERFVQAGRCGANILTALLFRTPEEIGEAVRAYREAREQAGFDPATGRVTLMIHTCIGDDEAQAWEAVREPFRAYLRSSISLWRTFSTELDASAQLDEEALLDYAFARYSKTSALFGTVETVRDQIERLRDLGVDEIACLIDFGVDSDALLRTVELLASLKTSPTRADRRRPTEGLGEFYDSLAVQSERVGLEQRYLTFGALPERVEGFSWIDALHRPDADPSQTRRALEAQLALRARFFDGVDFSSVRRVLDIGCGYGSDLIDLAQRHPHVEAFGQTLSTEQAEIASRRAAAAGVAERVHVRVGDSSLSLPEGPFDLVFGFEVAVYVEDKSALLTKIRERLAPEGRVILADFAATGHASVDHEASSSFIPTIEQWDALLSGRKLWLQRAVDVSQPVAHFLHLPDIDAALEAVRDELEPSILTHLRAWAGLGRALERGLVRYQVWTLGATRGEASLAELVADAAPVQLEVRSRASAPLADARILDLSRLFPAGYGTALLTELGAEVYKVELPHSGDYLRAIDVDGETDEGLFARINAGKRSVALDYRSAEGARLLRRLALEADVLVESDRPGNLARWGLDAEALLAINPRLIYVSVTGFGQAGAWADRRAHDLSHEALSGLLAMSAPAAKTPPIPPLPIADLAMGPAVALAVLGALIERDRSGRGAHLDLAAYDLMYRWTSMLGASVKLGVRPDPTTMPFAGAWPCYQCVRTRDGRNLALAAVEPPFWDLFCSRSGREDLRSRAFDPSAVEELRSLFQTRTREQWLALFEDVDICLTPVLELSEAASSDHVKDRGLVANRLSAPRLGQHGREILADLGVAAAEVERLVDVGVVHLPPK